MEGVIFDFNGSLFLDNDKHMKAWAKISQEIRGIPLSEEELHQHTNGVPNNMAIRYLNNNVPDPEMEERNSQLKEQYYREYCKADTENFHLIKGAEELFDELKKRGIPFTIASASIKPNIDFFIENFHLDNWIDPVDIVYDDGTYENKQEMFRKAADILGLPLSEITVIEDSISGIRSAIKTGVKDIRVINSGNVRDQVESLPEVRQICDDVSEIVIDEPLDPATTA